MDMEVFKIIVLSSSTLICAKYTYVNIKRAIASIKKVRAYRDLAKSYKDNTCNGPHRWMRIYSTTEKGEVRACKECGYCADNGGYFNPMQLKTINKQREINHEFEVFKKKKLSSIAHKMNIDEDEIIDLYNNLVSIKKDFHVKKLEEWQMELKEKSKK